MNIIVDGPDGSGKSTVVDFLCNEFNLLRHHLVKLKPNETVEDFYKKFIVNLKLSDNNIFDRCYFSNIVYSRVFKDSKIVSEEIQKEILERTNFVIFCLPSYDKYIEHFNSLRESRFELYSNMVPVYEEFKELSKTLKNSDKYIEYNMFTDSLDYLKSKIRSRVC